MPLTYRGFSAWIECNGQNLPEYLIAVDEEAHRVSCWIPGAVGQRFTVFWQDHAGQVDSCAFITLDGLLVPGRFLFGDGIASRGGVRVSKTTERPFVFQNLPDQDSSPQGTVKDAGMITLKIKRIKRVVGRWANPLQPLPLTSVLGKRKAGDLCVGFGEEERVYAQHDTTWSVVPYEDNAPSGAKPSTYVSFVFRYRSLEFLEAQGIVTEQKKPTQLVRAPIRQVTLPSHLQSEASSPPATHPAKKQKLMTPRLLPWPLVPV
ncbi:hypothetical protein BDZ97DRAFT_165350 [Flammula alnicola]|nr:hypothetical protein BDZ97DRAFT_165350 [Flammula alnicola]